MPALLAPLIAFALGVALGWVRAGVPDREQDGAPSSQPTAIVALFAALVVAPVNAYFLAFAGDWAYGYFLDSRAVPSALELCLVVLDAGAVLAGFTAARRIARARSFGAVMLLGGVPAGVALLVLLACYRRLRVDATFQQVRLDFGTEPVAGGRLGHALLWMLAMLLVGLAISVRALGGRRRSTPKPLAAAPAREAGLRPSRIDSRPR